MSAKKRAQRGRPANTKCIFCEETLPSSKPEHYIQACIGGRRKSKYLICDEHNSLLGETIDKELARKTELLSNLLGATTGRGHPAPKLSGSDVGQPGYQLAPGGILHQPKARPSYNNSTLTIRADARRPKQIKQLLTPLLKRHGKTLEDVDESNTKATLVPTTAVLDVKIENFPIDTIRALAKNCLLILSDHLKGDIARDALFKDARNFILNGHSPPGGRADYARRLTHIKELHHPKPPVHTFIVSGNATGVTAAAKLFGTFTFSFRLAENWPNPTFCVGHSVDPIKSEHLMASGFPWATQTKEDFEKPSPDKLPADKEEALIALIKEQRLKHKADDQIELALADLADGEEITETHLSRLAALLSELPCSLDLKTLLDDDD